MSGFHYDFLKLTIRPCNNTKLALQGKECAPEEEVDLLISNTLLRIVMMSSYFDKNGFGDETIKFIPSGSFFGIKKE